MKKYITPFLLLLSLSAFAALPPTAESMRRIQAISSSHDVFKALGPNQWIKSINDQGNGVYLVVSEQCALNVIVEPIQTHPPKMVPPLKVIAKQAVCLP